jgi:twitching motility protein PilT
VAAQPPQQVQPLQTVKVGEAAARFTEAQLGGARVKFEHIIGVAAGMGVSDIHIVGDSPLRVQKAGAVVTIDGIYVTNQEILMFVEMYGKQRGGAHELEHGRKGTVECMTQVGDVRLRMTYVREVHGFGCTARIVPGDPPSIHSGVFEDNPIPQKLIDITMGTRGGGLIIAEGPTGSGKTTLIAALLREVNDNLERHIYTIEDPIEFLHRSNRSLVTQREVGEHAESIPSALRTSLRYKPHIILVGELLDLETVKGAIEAANKGHLIFATSHASSAEEGVSALVNQFPGSEQKQIQVALSQALKAVVVQRLIPRVGGGLVPARELLLNTIPVALKIREGSFQQLSQAMKPTDNMFKFENDLARLIHEGLVDVEDAKQFANDRKELYSNVDMYVREHGMDARVRELFTDDEKGIAR